MIWRHVIDMINFKSVSHAVSAGYPHTKTGSAWHTSQNLMNDWMSELE